MPSEGYVFAGKLPVGDKIVMMPFLYYVWFMKMITFDKNIYPQYRFAFQKLMFPQNNVITSMLRNVFYSSLQR